MEPVEYCLLGSSRWWLCLTKDEWAGWVQALGSVLAIAGAGYGIWWQTRQGRRDARRLAGETLLARAAVLRLVAGQWEEFIQVQMQAGDTTPTELPVHHKVLKLAITEGLQVGLNEMPTEKCVEHMVQFRAAMTGGLEILEKHGPSRIGDHDVSRMVAGSRVLLKALAALLSEAKRLRS